MVCYLTKKLHFATKMKNYCYQKNKFILTQIFHFENCELFKIFGLNQSLYHFLFFKKTIPHHVSTQTPHNSPLKQD